MEAPHPSPGDLEPGHPEYRPGAGRFLVPAVTLPVAGVVVFLIATGQPGRGGLVGLWLVAGATAAYLLFVRPSVRVDQQGVLLRNLVRDVFVPWEELVEVRTRFALTLVTAEASYVSWAAAAPGRPIGSSWRGSSMSSELETPSTRRGGEPSVVPASRGLNGDSGAAAFLVEAAWSRWRQDAGRQALVTDDRAVTDDRSVPDDRAVMDDAGRGGTESGVRVTWHLAPLVIATLAAALGLMLAFGPTAR